MTRALIFEPSYRRLQARIDAIAGIETVAVTTERKFLLAGKEIDASDANVEVGWFNLDLFSGGPAVGAYLGAIMGSPVLKWVQSGAAGFDNPVFAQIVKKGARLTTSLAQSISMAEYVLATVLDHFQRGPDRRKAQLEHKWDRFTYREVMGSRWLIVGYGAIGRETAKRAKAFGAHVIGVRRSKGSDPNTDAMIGPEEILSHLPQADVVLLTVPLSKQTENLVNAEFLAAMRPDSVLVNVGRGGLIDEDALLKSLDAGRPEVAILDVFKTEPLPADNPIWSHPRIVLTPHASAISNNLGPRGDEQFVDNLRRFVAGKPLLSEANPRDVLGD